MRFSFSPIIEADAIAISKWRYPPPYDYYDWDPADSPQLLTLPAAHFHTARDEDDELAGFACFGEAGQVSAGERTGLYGEDLLDIGLGLRPDLTGRGIGLAYVLEVIELGRALFAPAGFRLSVAAFNQRAIRTYQRAGFNLGPEFDHLDRGVIVPFLLMNRGAEATPTAASDDLSGISDSSGGAHS